MFVLAKDSVAILIRNTLFCLVRKKTSDLGEVTTKSLALGDQPLTFELLMFLQRFGRVIREKFASHKP
jgi:hypothetical protein